MYDGHATDHLDASPLGLSAENEDLRARLATAENKVEHLEIALTSNRQIGAALGILMISKGLTMDEAFQALRQASQDRGVKLRELAVTVVYTGILD